MKFAKTLAIKTSHGVEIRLFCPKCDDMMLNATTTRPAVGEHHSVIVTGRCPKCGKTYLAILRLN